MARLLDIGLLVVSGLGLLLWVASYCVPPLRRREDATRLAVRCTFTLAALLFIASSTVQNRAARPQVFLMHSLVFAVAMLVMWGRHFAGLLASPVSSLFDGGGERIKAEPLYSIAESRRRQGHIHEAMWEIHAQLEKFPNDYRLQMLLAEIQAENANDLAGADATIRRLCSQRKHPPHHIAAALATLADWHLKYAQDVEAAAAAFKEIIERFPNTDVAKQAEQRLSHLGATSTYVEALDPRTIQMPLLQGRPVEASAQAAPAADPQEEAQRLVAHLTEFPGDAEAREELARLYAGQFQRLDLATEQLEQLISLPNESPRRIAKWLNLLADLQVQFTGDTQLATATLQRIIERFPGNAFAIAAQERLQYLPLEIKRYAKQRTVKFT